MGMPTPPVNTRSRPTLHVKARSRPRRAVPSAPRILLEPALVQHRRRRPSLLAGRRARAAPGTVTRVAACPIPPLCVAVPHSGNLEPGAPCPSVTTLDCAWSSFTLHRIHDADHLYDPGIPSFPHVFSPRYHSAWHPQFARTSDPLARVYSASTSRVS
ncbi:hypothetical protein AURDEDRAFT_172114 [Auricularia subglabra TFB-10046 SS5]|nr:hypothetical protein AURDEDRAFT_172114 [Auricularia subglabra TFB-10046 SS5]